MFNPSRRELLSASVALAACCRRRTAFLRRAPADDLWDEWPMLLAQFQRLENWIPHMSADSWPDGDMLPQGRLALGERDSRFTADEQQTLIGDQGAGSRASFLQASRNALGVHWYSSLNSLLKYEEFLYPTE